MSSQYASRTVTTADDVARDVETTRRRVDAACRVSYETGFLHGALIIIALVLAAWGAWGWIA